jgi:hypothetical protein
MIYDSVASALKKITRSNNAKKTVRSATSTDTVGATDDVLLYSGASFTATLPSAATAGAGKVMEFVHGDSTLGRVYTITDGGSFTKKLSTEGEKLRLVSNGSAWSVLARTIKSEWTSFSPTIGTTTNATATGYWRRVGDSMQVRFSIAYSGANTQGSPDVTLPGSLAMDTSKILDTASALMPVGQFAFRDSSASGNLLGGGMYYQTSTTLRPRYPLTGAASNAMNDQSFDTSTNAPVAVASGDKIDGYFEVPIANWEG